MAEEEECIRVSSVGPCPRYGHSLTEFSPGHFLLFGGTDGTTLHNDLFVLIRGQRALSAAASPCCPPRVGRSSWTELRPLVAAPQPRFGHSCHLHHDKKQLIFFGGTDHVSWFNDMYSLPLLETGISRTFEKIESPPGVPIASTCMCLVASEHLVLQSRMCGHSTWRRTSGRWSTSQWASQTVLGVASDTPHR
ncbi:Hypothetical protein, putative [Bodo saltans]|uniref:Uncharacterized protein n=1 Tax=Bodo saltans TaxID=75058 RepID=A0A0S4JS19_BODSA|nr:Hypothetical protein, putative [Bodo saltans]|eukprot:CUG94307.1 Hypothetical protein, putative [Bodo saltans]